MATHQVFLPGESRGQRNMADYSLWGRKRQTKLLLLKFTLEKEMATHSNILARRISCPEEPCELQCMG